MRSAENLINSFVIARIIFYYKNIALKRFNLLLGFCKKVFQEFFIIRIKIVAHSYILYIVIFLNQAKKKMKNENREKKYRKTNHSAGHNED